MIVPRETSLKVFHEIERTGLLSALRLKVLRALLAIDGGTASEVARHLDMQRNTVNPRMAELARRGVIAVEREGVCGCSGHTALVWNLTGKLPIDFDEASPKPKSKAALLRKELEEWKRESVALRKECADKTLEIQALKKHLAKWGRPTDEARALRANPGAFTELPLSPLPPTAKQLLESTE